MRLANDAVYDHLAGTSRNRIPIFDRSLSIPLRGSLILDGATVYYGDGTDWIPLASASQIPIVSNEGTGLPVYDDIASTPTNILLRTITSDPTVGNEGIAISLSSPTPNTLQIGNTLTGENVGIGLNSAEVFSQKSGNHLQFRRLVPAAGITINQIGDIITFASNGGGGGLSGLSNETGPGLQIYDVPLSIGTTAFLRTIQAGTGLSAAISGGVGQEVITFTNTSPASSVTLSSAGGTETLVNDGAGPTLATKGLTAGAGITLTPSGTDITISAPGSISPTSSNYSFAYDTTTQFISVINTYQDITFNTNANLNGWTHVAGTANFVCTQTGLYQITAIATFQKGNGDTDASIRLAINSNEIPGSNQGFHLHTSAADHFVIPTTAFANVTSGQILTVQMAADNTNPAGINPVGISGPGVVLPSIKVTIVRLA